MNKRKAEEYLHEGLFNPFPKSEKNLLLKDSIKAHCYLLHMTVLAQFEKEKNSMKFQHL